ncbi:hypothetical protein [Metabacillus halosaccharovorans]|nr:hypothetical protein [Metabacillus halosaccharovorans]
MGKEKSFIAMVKDKPGVNGEGKVLHSDGEGQNGGEWGGKSPS